MVRILAFIPVRQEGTGECVQSGGVTVKIGSLEAHSVYSVENRTTGPSGWKLKE